MYSLEGLLAGRVLSDRYLIEEVIGRGGMGAVYRATDERLGRSVAVKVIAVAAPDRESHARLRARFHREARAAAGIHHPNVVAIYDFGTDPKLELDFLVMELLRGEDLSHRLARGALPTHGEAVTLLHQAARGLAAGHRAGLIHRDVKPGNLHLEPGDHPGDFQLKVLDFGIAEIVADDQTLTHLTAFGRSPFSPAYASPEQLRGITPLSPATDVFSLGAVAYQLLTGERAFTSPDPERMATELSAARGSLPSRMSHLPVTVREAVRRALAHDPGDRFADAAEFAAALAPTLDGAREAAPERATRARAAAAVDPPVPRWRERHQPQFADTETVGPTRPTAFAPPPKPLDTPREQHVPLAQRRERPRRGVVHRAASAVWNFTLTCIVAGLFIGTWVMAVFGMQTGAEEELYGGIAGAVVLAPLVVHRVMGRRGSYRLALIGSIAASIAAVFLVGPNGDTRALLSLMFALQLLGALVIERVTRRRESRIDADPEHTPLRA